MVTIQLDEDKRVIKTFGIHTNISHLKQADVPVLSFIGLNGELSYMDVNVKKSFFSIRHLANPARKRDISFTGAREKK
jgi:hypothetical protein